MKTLVLDRQAILNNIEVVKKRAGKAAIYAVLSGDGQGVGVAELAGLLRQAGVGRFAVYQADEAAALRKGGFVDEEILMLRSTTDRAELERLIDLGVVCTVGSTEAGMVLNGLAEDRSTIVEAQVQVDAGTGFGGFLPDEQDKVMAVFRSLPNVAVTGVHTHLTGASESEVRAQLQEFQRLLAVLHAAGFETGVVHAAGSYALMRYDFALLDAVRAGSALMGRCRRFSGDGLQKVGQGEVALDEIRWLPKGHTVGARKPVKLRKPTRVAVLPIGYQNGFGAPSGKEYGLLSALRLWWASRKRTVRVGTQKAKIIGQIGELETVVDVTHLRCAAGDRVLFDIDPIAAKGLTRELR